MKQRKSAIFPLFAALLLGMCSCGTAPIPVEPTAPTEAITIPAETVPTTTSPPPLPSESTDAADAVIDALLADMTLEEKVGQMFLARCPERGAAEAVETYALGGYILFQRDFSGLTAETVTATIADYQAAAAIPLFIGVDEEGGYVNRISTNPHLRTSPFLSPQKLYDAGGFARIREDTAEKCQLLKALGINLNFAPVCDVSLDSCDFIHYRTFGEDAAQTADYVRHVTQVMAKEEVGCVLKHFPGYGNNADTHTGIAYDARPYDTFVTSDFLPFTAGIEHGTGMVMVSHNIVTCMDAESPASLSVHVHRILREVLGYDGVIITDDLSMDGIRDYAADDRAAVRAVLAGNDMLCCTDFETQIPAVLAAVEEGTISEDRIDAAVERILRLKQALGILP